MSSIVRRSVAAAGAVLAATGATTALMLGTAGAANAGEPCSGSSYCVKPSPEEAAALRECIPPAAIGALAGPRGAVMGGANCVYNKGTE